MSKTLLKPPRATFSSRYTTRSPMMGSSFGEAIMNARDLSQEIKQYGPRKTKPNKQTIILRKKIA